MIISRLNNENVLMFIGTLVAFVSVILIWKKINKKGWPYPFPPQPEPTTKSIQKIKDRWHRMNMGMLDFGVLHYALLFLISWVIVYFYLKPLGNAPVVAFEYSALFATFTTFLVYLFIYGMKKRDVDSIRWDTIRTGWPWYEEKHTPTWLVRKKEEEKDQKRE